MMYRITDPSSDVVLFEDEAESPNDALEECGYPLDEAQHVQIECSDDGGDTWIYRRW